MKPLLSIIFFFLSGNILFGQSVTTIAGQLNTATSTDGPAETADFNNPHGLAVDKEGTIYVADRYNHTIRKISRAGIVSTFAGKAGQIGDRDGRGENALFHEPWGIAVNEEGEVLVADTKNNRIRKIEPDGTVTTIAGNGDFGSDDGVGRNATFGNPTGIDSDKQGKIYIADHSTHVIRVIELDGTVRTIAGKANEIGDADGLGENARFYRPYGLALDHDENILIADEWNHKIRKIDPDGNVTTLAGTGVLGHENGLAAESEFYYPWDITLDAEGNIYIGDGYNYVIRMLSPDGIVKNLAGNLLTSGAEDGFAYDARFSGVTALDWSAIDNKIYIADAYNDLIRMVDYNEVETETDKDLNQLFFPTAFTPNQDGVNDIFRPRGGLPSDYKIIIYDHWGAQIFSSNVATVGWDGTMKNRPLPQGNYAYVTSFFNGFEMETVSGVVSLLR